MTAELRVDGLPHPGRTLVVGVVNVTPDSFSDGGEWLDPDDAIVHGLELLAEGADLVDVGGESTRPGAVRPTQEVELARVIPVVRALSAAGGIVSVDTMRPPLSVVRARTLAASRADKLPVQMLNDRILVDLEADGERRSSGGILIPATAQMGKRLAWGEVVAVGPNVRTMEAGDQVLFNPEDRYEVEVRGHDYLILRERDIHAVAANRLEEGSTGLYL